MNRRRKLFVGGLFDLGFFSPVGVKLVLHSGEFPPVCDI